MVRLQARRPVRTPTALALASILALALAGCGIKGPLVPGRASAPDARPPPEATTPPNIPSANPPVNSQPAP